MLATVIANVPMHVAAIDKVGTQGNFEMQQGHNDWRCPNVVAPSTINGSSQTPKKLGTQAENIHKATRFKMMKRGWSDEFEYIKIEPS